LCFVKEKHLTIQEILQAQALQDFNKTYSTGKNERFETK
jgi:hypothetical protein